MNLCHVRQLHDKMCTLFTSATLLEQSRADVVDFGFGLAGRDSAYTSSHDPSSQNYQEAVRPCGPDRMTAEML